VKLGIDKTTRSGIAIIGDKKDMEIWTASSGTNGQIGMDIGRIDLTLHPLLRGFYQSWKNKEANYFYELLEDDLKDYFKTINSSPDYPVQFDLAGLPLKLIHSSFFFPEGALFAFSPEPLTAEASKIFNRFAGVFAQTYRRFLDLQKAEAQARESQIQLALERVRAKTLAMQHSRELLEVIRVVSQQLQQLDFRFDHVSFGVNNQSQDYHFWTSMANTLEPRELNVPYTNNPVFENIRKAQKEQLTFFTDILTPEENDQWTLHMLKFMGEDFLTENAKSYILNKSIARSVAISPNIFLIIAKYKPMPYSEEQNDILKRFGQVFDQSYTRFLDLQKAEAQAREAQIEAALEKVRSRSLAMHNSDELNEVVTVFLQKLKELGILMEMRTSNIIVFEDSEKDFIQWVASPMYDSSFRVRTPYFDNLILNDMWDVRQNGIEFYSKSYPSEIKNEVFRFLFEHSDFKNILSEEEKKIILDYEHYELAGAFQKHSAIGIVGFTGKLVTLEEEYIMKRFSKVFEQAYIRFLDLQKAEAQAKEAQIEVALERVRSRSMGMQKSEELKEVIQVVYEQFVQLNIKIEHTGFVIDYKTRDDYNIWIADPLGVPSQIIVPYFDSVYYNRFNEAKEKGENFFTTNLAFEKKNRFYQKLFDYVPGLTEEAKEFYFSCPGLAASTVLSEDVCLYIETFSGIPFTDEENRTLMRFGKVFQQTYTRFNDLQKAEAQASEAIKRASVDRVRAEIASMRTTSDLERIQPLIWNELKTLGVPFIRCGVFIMDEEKQEVQTMLSTPDGKAIATLHVPFEFDLTIITNGLKYWRNKEVYQEHWDEGAFSKNWIKLASLRETSMNAAQAEHPPERLYLHMLPFFQGMLYVGNPAPLKDDELQLVQNLADAFSTAYARYEDFNKLETAKKQVDSTLNELQATQRQLIQSEKMASLGELTAGIAHEIQNPLNFVNNFSEVNMELIDEASQANETGNPNEVKEFLSTLKDNEEKINHHGRRADAIVKGMLQHSRSSNSIKEPTDINALADEYLRLSYHGLRAKDNSFNSILNADFDKSIGNINIIPQDIGRVLLNLYNNALYAVSEKRKSTDAGYEPEVTVNTKKSDNKITITVKDHGGGIPQMLVDKIFQPFFTTKPTGQGTGLGLSLSYDIIKAHGGEIRVETKEGEGSKFIIQLPFN
jgi:signal transduction histidine kinase